MPVTQLLQYLCLWGFGVRQKHGETLRALRSLKILMSNLSRDVNQSVIEPQPVRLIGVSQVFLRTSAEREKPETPMWSHYPPDSASIQLDPFSTPASQLSHLFRDSKTLSEPCWEGKPNENFLLQHLPSSNTSMCVRALPHLCFIHLSFATSGVVNHIVIVYMILHVFYCFLSQCVKIPRLQKMNVLQDLGVLFISVLGLERGKDVGFLPKLCRVLSDERANHEDTWILYIKHGKSW